METAVEAEPRRTWGQRIKRAFVWIVGFVLVAILALWLNAQYDNYQLFKRELIEFRNVRIGSPRAEVRYTLGEPQSVVGNVEVNDMPGFFPVYDVGSTTGPNMMPKGKTIEDFNIWDWQDGDELVGVQFDPKTKLVTSFNCYVSDASTSIFSCEGIGGIYAGKTEDAVVGLLGTPDRVEFSEGSATKTLFYTPIGLEVTLSKRKVYMWKKTEPQDLGLWWWLTHGRPS